MKRIRNDERGKFFRHDIASGYLNGPKLRNCYRAVKVSCRPPGRRTLEYLPPECFTQRVDYRTQAHRPRTFGQSPELETGDVMLLHLLFLALVFPFRRKRCLFTMEESPVLWLSDRRHYSLDNVEQVKTKRVYFCADIAGAATSLCTWKVAGTTLLCDADDLTQVVISRRDGFFLSRVRREV